MILRTMFTAFALICMCLVGCKSDEENTDNDANGEQNESADNNDDDQDNDQRPPARTVQYEPFRAEDWRPDTGKANPDAWQPADSEATKATGSIFKALKNAVKNDPGEKKQ